MPTASAPDDVDWERLSPEGRWTVAQVAWPISEGFTQGEVADELGIPKRLIRRALNDLRTEIRPGGSGRRGNVTAVERARAKPNKQ